MGQSTPINKHQSPIPHVLCPHCGQSMRLAEVDTGSDGEEVLRFDCTCKFEYRISRPVQEEPRATSSSA